MTAKEFLSRYRALDLAINAKLDEVARLRALAERVTPSAERSSGSGGGNVPDRVGRTVAKIVDLEREIDREVDRLVEVRGEIEAKINEIDDVKGRIVLTERYLGGKSLFEISKIMNYDYGYVRHLHGKFLKILEKSTPKHMDL